MNNIANDDLGIADIINALCRGASFVNGNLAVEGKLGFEASARLKVGESITARIAGTLGVGFMDHTLLMEDGAAVILSADDPLKPNLDILENYLDTALDNVENGIRGTLIYINALT